MEPTTTADRKYLFKTKFYGQTLSYWITVVHREMSRLSGWEYIPLVPGTFGYDNQAHSIADMLSYYEDGMSRESLADCVHRGWTENYIFWRDNKPWESDTDYKKINFNSKRSDDSASTIDSLFERSENYKAPFKPLGDERRNKMAYTCFPDLPEDEKNKDYIIVDFLLVYLKNYTTTH